MSGSSAFSTSRRSSWRQRSHWPFQGLNHAAISERMGCQRVDPLHLCHRRDVFWRLRTWTDIRLPSKSNVDHVRQALHERGAEGCGNDSRQGTECWRHSARRPRWRSCPVADEQQPTRPTLPEESCRTPTAVGRDAARCGSHQQRLYASAAATRVPKDTFPWSGSGQLTHHICQQSVVATDRPTSAQRTSIAMCPSVGQLLAQAG